MSFGSGGFGGFGSNNNQQSTFGGFGSNNNSGFGSNTNNSSSIFGSNNNQSSGGGMFGSNNNTSSPFGGGGGGFGSGTNTNTTFGSKPFGASTTGNLFGGGSTSGSTFGGFGSTSNNTSSGFGSNTGGGLFGQNKTGFGSSTGSGGLFGGGGTSGGFGSNTSGGFGSTTSGFGAGGNPPPNNGTASTPFSAHTEKDGTNSTQHYQTITFQQPYQPYSLEELRVSDYNQGRRYGNQNGQAGAFGQSTGFGGFGTSNTNTNTTAGFGQNTNTGSGGLFGNNNNTSSFGQNSNSTFGSNTNTGGGLFGQNKPTGGGLFGGTAATQPGTSGGLFGATTSNNSGGFGSGSGGFGSSTSGGGLFGGNNQQQNQTKPFGGFGTNTSTTASNPFGGGSSNTFGQGNSSGGLFGQQNQTSSAPGFGSNQSTTNTGGGLFGNTGGAFGQNNQNQTQSQPSGSLFGSGVGFGQNNQQNQQKPGSLFGSSTTGTTGGGLFGQNNQNQQSGGGLFGGSTTQNQGSTLFGSKPTTTGTSLFGNNNTANTGTTGGGLFGNLGTQNNQQNTGSSLFGGQQNQQKPGGLFGGSTTNMNASGGLFSNLGQSNTNNASTLGSSLFSSQNQQQQNQQPANNSLFGASGNSLLQTSMNTNPYGNDALFAGLATPTQSPGPLATPLSSSQKNRKSAILPQHKLNPSASTRLLTPQNKRPGGYGFTYSTYGTPNSASSQSSPGFSGSLFGSSSLSRSLGKSLSTSNLRNSFTPETSILAPGAFSTNGRSFGTGSLKRLNINRGINPRTPLFDEPTPAKRVSFAGPDVDDAFTNGTTNGLMSGALVPRNDPNDASPGGSSTTVNGDATTNGTAHTEMEEVNGKALTPVPENGALAPRTSASLNIQNGQAVDPKPGSYWSSPSIDQLKKMSKRELENVSGFTVGRDKIGQIEFNQGRPVNLSDVPLDKIFDDIVSLTPRNATVYGDKCSVTKPQLGSGLNYPSRITLGNSWPRNKAGKKDAKHLERLKRVHGTTFEKYVANTGDWIFTVPHFSSYGLDYDKDYSDEDDESSKLSPVPDTPAQLGSSQMTGTPQEDSYVSPTQSSPDDTFDFKKGMRKRASVPGGFGDEVAYEEDEEMEDTRGESFLGERSVGSLDGQHEADYTESESESAQDQSMADSVSGPVQTTEQAATKESDPFKDSIKPKSILKASQPIRPAFGTPSKGQLVFDDDWANQLQRTISPKKQDRQALRENQSDVLRERDGNATKLSQSVNGRTIASAMDLMDSLFGETDKHKVSTTQRVGTGIEIDARDLESSYLPYPKRPKTSDDLDQLTSTDKDFHSCNKPHFSETILVYANKGTVNLEGGVFLTAQEPLIGAQKDIRFMKLPTFFDAVPPTLEVQKQHTKVWHKDEVPSARIQTNPAPLEFSDLADAVSIDTDAGAYEQKVWQLLSLLFDDSDGVPSDMNHELFIQHKERFRKEKLSEFWKNLVLPDAENQAQHAKSAEEKAIAYLSCNNVADACHALLHGLDLRLATMVAQIGGDAAMRRDVTSQIEEWRRMDVLSEMDDPIRALYELLSGNCAQSEGNLSAGRENKVSTFNIANRFGLDWRRAFGLRLWYGIMLDEPIELAVAQFADALAYGREDVKPVPWFVQQGSDMGWDDPQSASREDLLWGILKLYASSKMELAANIEDVLAPENVSGHPLNARLSFQLFQLFRSRQEDLEEEHERKVTMPAIRDSEGLRSSLLSSTTSTTEKDEQAKNPLVELGDKITLTYAASLHTTEHWTTAVWVYTHLSSSAMRQHYIRSLLTRYSNTYSLVDIDKTYTYLTQELRIPVTWLHSAAALQAKTEGDPLRQAMHLIKADELDEAHEVLCRSVGPESIISRDYDALRELMGGFIPTPTNSPIADNVSIVSSACRKTHPQEPVRGWGQGGQIYFDYIELLDLTGQRSSYRIDEELNQQIHALLSKLQHALEVVARDRWEGCGLEERVALTEIAGTVAGLITMNKHTDRARVLKLPLTEDLWLKHSCELSTNYYRNVMASSK